MKQQTVFEVVDVAPRQSDEWLVRGRAYEDVRIGDTIFPDHPATLESGAARSFQIISISTYGFETNELGRMMTGNLVVRGKDGERLRQAHFLVRHLPSRAAMTVASESELPRN